MRLGKVVAAIPFLAVGLTLWKHARWVVGPENADEDGTIAGLQSLVSCGFALFFLGVSLVVLLTDAGIRFFRDAVASLGTRHPVTLADVDEGQGPRSAHPPEETSAMFN